MRYIYGYAVSVTQLSINSHSVVFNKTQPILNQLVTASQQHLLSLSRKIQKHRFPNGLQSFEIKKQYKPFSFDLCVAIKDSKSLVTCSSLYKLKPFPYSNSPSCFILCLLSLKRSQDTRGAWLCHHNTLLRGTGAALWCPQSHLLSRLNISSSPSPAPDLVTPQQTCCSLLMSFLDWEVRAKLVTATAL